MILKYLWLAASIVLGAAGQILMKWGVESLKLRGMPSLSWSSLAAFAPVAAGLASYALSSVFWLLALRQFPLSTAYPMVSLSYIIVMICGSLLFQETVSAQHWFGAAFIGVGVLLIARAGT